MYPGRYLCCWLFLLLCVPGSGLAQEWDPEDTTFDPGIQSVVIGNRSWLGDPCPFVYMPLPRIGYTYVAATRFEGYPPSVQISLIVPLEPGETQSVGGMLMMNEKQTRELLEKLEAAIKHTETTKDTKPNPERYQSVVATAMDHVKWTLSTITADEKPRIQFESSTDDKNEAFQFSANAARKLVGAIKHALSQLTEDSDG